MNIMLNHPECFRYRHETVISTNDYYYDKSIIITKCYLESWSNTVFLLVVNILYTFAMMLPDILELAKNNHY